MKNLGLLPIFLPALLKNLTKKWTNHYPFCGLQQTNLNFSNVKIFFYKQIQLIINSVDGWKYKNFF